MHLTHRPTVCFRYPELWKGFKWKLTSLSLQERGENSPFTEWQHLYLTMHLSCSGFDLWSPLLIISQLPQHEVLSSRTSLCIVFWCRITDMSLLHCHLHLACEVLFWLLVPQWSSTSKIVSHNTLYIFWVAFIAILFRWKKCFKWPAN